MGKQHGSLAQAGKVKAMTPKACKNETNNKPTQGRAKKRKQYNARFLA